MFLNITVKANSKVNSFIVSSDGTIRVNVKAPAQDGKTNECLVEFLSEIFKVPKSKIQLLKGHASSHKKINILTEEKYVMQILKEIER